MVLGSIVNVLAATAGAFVGAVEGVAHLGGEVSKLSSKELLYGKTQDTAQDTAVAEADNSPSEADASPPEASGAELAEESSPEATSQPEASAAPLPPGSPVKAATLRINARAKENETHALQNSSINREFRFPVRSTDYAAKPASRMQHCKSLHDQKRGTKESRGSATLA